MAIVNRDLDPTQQRLTFQATPGLVGVSALIHLGVMPCAAQLLAVASSAFGLSGAATVGVQIQRFVPGVGLTTIPMNSASLLTISAFSTSGIQLQTLPAAGATLAQLLKGDDLQLVTSTASTAATYVVDAVIQILQDVKSDYGV
jgi:hypothetical protein